MKLQNKLLMLYAVCTVLILVAMGSLLYSQLKQDQIDTLQIEVNKQLQNLDFAMSAFFDEAKNDIRTLVSHETVRTRNDTEFTSFLNAVEKEFTYQIGPLEEQIIRILNAFRTTHPYVNSVYMGRSNGSFVRSHKRKRPTRYDPRQRPWYKLGLANPGKVMITSPYASVTTSDVNIGVVTALVDRTGSVYGVIGADVTLENLTDYIADYKVGLQGKILLTDDKGTILASGIPQQRFIQLESVFPDHTNFILDNDQGVLNITASNERYVFIFITSAKLKWKLAAMIPEQQIHQKVYRSVRQNLSALFIALVLLSALTLVGLYRFVLYPVQSLTKGTVQITETGDLNHRIKSTSSDELGTLTQFINEMLRVIQNTKEELISSNKKLEDQRIHLEEVVQQRTAELEAANIELTNEIAVRKDSESRYRSLYENAGEAILVAQDGRWRFVNPQAERLFGYDRNTMVDMQIRRTVHPDDQEMVMTRHEQRLRGLSPPTEYSFRIIDSLDRTKWVELKVAGFQWDDKPATLCFMTDISEKVAAQKALQTQKAYLEQLFQTAPEAISLVNAEDRVTRVNTEFIRMFGYSEEEALGHSLDNLIIPAALREEGKALKSQIASGDIVLAETVRQCKDGTMIDVSVTGTSIVIDGQLQGVYAIYRDISERKRTEIELKAAKEAAELSNEKLKELDKLKSMFIASMSHELRTPLNSIIGFTGIMVQGMTGPLNEKQKDHLTRVYNSAKHLLDLITDVIDISKIEAGRIDIFKEDLVLSELVEEAVIFIEPQLEAKELQLEVTVPDDLHMLTDRKRLLQCLINYLSNAVKFTETGGITVEAGLSGEQIEITVTDTGIGISQQDQAKLFEAFERLDSHLRVKAGGTGLGLYLTRKLTTEILGGEIFVRSQLGKGSTFGLQIPITLNSRDNRTVLTEEDNL